MSKFWSTGNSWPPPEGMGLGRYVIRHGFFAHNVGMFAFVILMLHAVAGAMGWMEASLFQVALGAALFSLFWGVTAIYKYNHPNSSESSLFDDQNSKPAD